MLRLLLALALLAQVASPPEISVQQEVEMAVQARWPESEWNTALCIVERESTFRPWIVSPTQDYGLFGINRIHRVSYDWDRILEVDYNAAAAYDLWRTNGWRIWTTWRYCRG